MLKANCGQLINWLDQSEGRKWTSKGPLTYINNQLLSFTISSRPVWCSDSSKVSMINILFAIFSMVLFLSLAFSKLIQVNWKGNKLVCSYKRYGHRPKLSLHNSMAFRIKLKRLGAGHNSLGSRTIVSPSSTLSLTESGETIRHVFWLEQIHIWKIIPVNEKKCWLGFIGARTWQWHRQGNQNHRGNNVANYYYSYQK